MDSSLLRDRIVMGISCADTQKQLLGMKELTLDSVLMCAMQLKQLQRDSPPFKERPQKSTKLASPPITSPTKKENPPSMSRKLCRLTPHTVRPTPEHASFVAKCTKWSSLNARRMEKNAQIVVNITILP